MPSPNHSAQRLAQNGQASRPQPAALPCEIEPNPITLMPSLELQAYATQLDNKRSFHWAS